MSVSIRVVHSHVLVAELRLATPAIAHLVKVSNPMSLAREKINIQN